MTAILLCGFMGCGKSTIGKELEKILNCDFFDLDLYIVEKEKMSIPEIFEKHGEKYFREKEATYLSKLSKEGNIIALGGGAIINPDTAKIAKECGNVIFIDTPFEICYERIKDDKNRPIATSKSKEQLKELFDYRMGIYKKNSKFCVSGQGTPFEVAQDISEIIKKTF